MISVIIPYVNEYPQVAFTVASLLEELRGRADFEIITIDNGSTDKGFQYLQGMATVNAELVALQYSDRLSHWQAKNYGVQYSKGSVLFFCDAHCVVGRDSIIGMYDQMGRVDGTLHLPLTYHILEQRKLIYALRADLSRAEIHYTFGTLRQHDGLLRVPCMSTCGMMMRRELFDRVNGWPTELGIYGGGENYLNFTLATLGVSIHVYCPGVLHHHGEKRGYSWNHRDYLRNRAIAAYVYGGTEFLRSYLFNQKAAVRDMSVLFEDVRTTCREHREIIKPQQVVSIEQWVAQAEGST